jgi:uncharacterized protein (DUF3820 family)
MNEPPLLPDPTILTDLVSIKMPFGRFKDRTICQLPVSYLEWFYAKGFPKGRLGTLLATMHEIKINGLEELLKPLLKNNVPLNIPKNKK